MKNEPLVCVVLINYNTYNDTVECVKSILNAEYKNLRICIVDNNSEYGPIKYSDIITKDKCDIIRLATNKGFSGGNNIGISHCQRYNPDYYLILNNDTIVDKNFLKPLIECCEKKENVGIVTGKIFYYDDPSIIWFGGSYYERKLGEYKIKGIGCQDCSEYDQEGRIYYATACFWLIPAEVIKKVGKMDETYFLYYEDADYCERVKQFGYDIYYIPRSIIYHKESRTTSKGSDLYIYYTNRNYLFFIKKYARKNKNVLILKRMLLILKQTIRGHINYKVTYRIYRDFLIEKRGKAIDIC